ncbi:MAG: glycosyltransferase family 4 protein [Bosea sp. (in: a-proteobacteria)]
MRPIVFAIPGDLTLPTGGYAYDRRMLHEWQRSGVNATHLALPGSFPNPTERDFAETGRLLLNTPWDSTLLIDGLAYGAFPEGFAAGLAGRVVALVHHPLGLEAGISPARAAELIALETGALRHTTHIVTTSPLTKRLLVADFGVDESQISVAEPGTDAAAPATGSGSTRLNLLTVGSIVPRKAHSVLVEALAGLTAQDWHLTIIGAEDRSPETSAALRGQIMQLGLSGRISMRGAVDDAELASAYASADIFLLPSLFEGFGMVLTEAVARGLPIICTTGGAAAETVPDSVAIKVEPGHAGKFSDAISALMRNKDERQARADAAWALAADLPRWPDSARIVFEACQRISG